MANPNQDARSGRGKYIRTTETAERDAEAARLRTRGLTYDEIGLELGITKSTAQKACQRALADIVREPAEDLLKIELQRLDLQLVRLHQLETAARTVLEARHITVNNGKVIYNPGTEEPMEDDGPVLAAIDRLIKIEAARNQNSERRAKLLGLDAALKVEATVYEVTQQDIALREWTNELKAKNATVEAQLRGAREHPE